MATQVPGTQDEAMPDAPGSGNADGQDEDAIIAGEDLVVRVVGVFWSLRLKSTESLRNSFRAQVTPQPRSRSSMKIIHWEIP